MLRNSKSIVLLLFMIFSCVATSFSQCDDQWVRFGKAIDENTEFGRKFVNAVDDGEEALIDAWEALDNAGVRNLQDNADNFDKLRDLDNYMKEKSLSVSETTKLIDDAGGPTKWKTLGRNADELYKSLSTTLKNSYDDLISKGLKAVEEGNVIKFTDDAGTEIAKIIDNELVPTKWSAYFKGDIITKTESGYWLIKNGDNYGFDLGYKDGRVFTSEQVNAYHRGIGNHSPYKPLGRVYERDLQIGDKIYIVEYKHPPSGTSPAPNPGGWGSKNKISTVKELREDLAVLEGWKDADINGGLVVREYTIKKPLPVRDGVVGPLQEVGDVATAPIYRGGEQQYEFLEYLGGDRWKEYLKVTDEAGDALLKTDNTLPWIDDIADDGLKTALREADEGSDFVQLFADEATRIKAKEGWKALDDARVDDIIKNDPFNINVVSNHLDETRKTVSQISSEIVESGSYSKWLSDHYVTYSRNGFKIDKVSIENKFVNHLEKIETINRNKGVVGGHNIDVFKASALPNAGKRIDIISELDNGVDGFKIIEYKLLKSGPDGRAIPNEYVSNGKTWKKTVYDKRIWSEEELKQYAYKGFKKAIDNNSFDISDRSFEASVDGIKVAGHYIDNGSEKTISTWWLEN